MNILSVNMADAGGGAEKIAVDLLHAYRRLGHAASLAVGFRMTDDPNVIQLPQIDTKTPWKRPLGACLAALTPLRGRVRGAAWLHTWLGRLAEPARLRNWWHGYEDFAFPGSRALIGCAPQRPDIFHIHNLHGGYFDLTQLASLSRDFPVVLTLHDQWLLTGHCAVSFGCERWRHGCGVCPDLGLYPAIRKDATARNWRVKAEIFRGCRLFVAAPSAWLLSMAEQSMLAPAIVEARVIANGVDTTVFAPGSKAAARRVLGLPADDDVLLFAAAGTRDNPYKDYATILAAVHAAAARLAGRRMIFVALGAPGETTRVGETEIRHVGFVRDPRRVALFYQAADIYLHAARSDNFPTTILEALACGTPVIATAVGGIGEQIDDLDAQGPTHATGILVGKGDAAGMSSAIVQLLTAPDLRERLGRNAASVARSRFNLERQAAEYAAWFGKIIAARQAVRSILPSQSVETTAQSFPSDR